MSTSHISRRKDKLRKLLKRHVEEQDNKCCYCSIPFNSPDNRKFTKPTIEHKVPRPHFITVVINEKGEEKLHVRVEADSYENTAAACWGCNNKRGDIPYQVFVDLKLWLPERRKQLWLWKLRMDFVREAHTLQGSIKLLKAMGRFHQNCEKGWAKRETEEKADPEEYRRKLNHCRNKVRTQNGKGSKYSAKCSASIGSYWSGRI